MPKSLKCREWGKKGRSHRAGFIYGLLPLSVATQNNALKTTSCRTHSINSCDGVMGGGGGREGAKSELSRLQPRDETNKSTHSLAPPSTWYCSQPAVLTKCMLNTNPPLSPCPSPSLPWRRTPYTQNLCSPRGLSVSFLGRLTNTRPADIYTRIRYIYSLYMRVCKNALHTYWRRLLKHLKI